MTKTFSPSRLKVARERRGLTKQALERTSGVSARSIIAYEQGELPPSDDTMETLARTLRFPVAFFYMSTIETPDPLVASFRSMKKMTAKQRNEALAAGALAAELSRWLDEKFAMPPVNLPVLRGVDPEIAAENVRNVWGLGVKRVANMVHLLERQGVRVFSLAQDAVEVDAFSMWFQQVPMVFMNSMKSVERSRFDAAHELGHLVLHRHGSPRAKELEAEADRFASAFLMPKASVITVAPRAPHTVDRLAALKEHWGTSVKSIARRLRDLGFMTEWQYRSIYIELAQRGQHYEPRALEYRETSQVLAKVFEQLRTENMQKVDIAKALGLHVADLEALAFGLVVHPGGRTPEPSSRSSASA